jgi:hypothetical protein
MLQRKSFLLIPSSLSVAFFLLNAQITSACTPLISPYNKLTQTKPVLSHYVYSFLYNDLFVHLVIIILIFLYIHLFKKTKEKLNAMIRFSLVINAVVFIMTYIWISFIQPSLVINVFCDSDLLSLRPLFNLEFHDNVSPFIFFITGVLFIIGTIFLLLKFRLSKE